MPEDIPPVIIEPPSAGRDYPTRNYELRAAFFEKYSRQYEEIANQIFGRVILFFKYRLHQPLLNEITDSRRYPPTWWAEDGQEIEPGRHLFLLETPRGMASDDFGVTNLLMENEPELHLATENEITPNLCEQIMSDAQAAAYLGNYRRAVLEMAMACEIAIRRVYFSKSSAAGLALEFMEDNQKMAPKVTLVDYLDKIAKYALGETFQEIATKTDMLNIKNLFHGRNKVVHSGKLAYSDENNKKIMEIDRRVLAKWWISVEKLLDWLDRNRDKKSS